MSLRGLQSSVVIIAFVATVFLTRSLWPRTETVHAAPRIVTVYDTVARIDTIWRTKMLERTRWDTTYLERLTVSEPETVTVERPFMLGISAIFVGEKIGDTTMAFGFWQGMNPHTGQEERRDWRAHWYTAGPLQAISLDTFPPRAAFYDPPKRVKPCATLCKAMHVGAGILAYAAWSAIWDATK